jgi:archaemetzincin
MDPLINLLLLTLLSLSHKPPITIALQPFNDLPKEDVTYVLNHLKQVYPSVKVLRAINLPRTAYYGPRNRYKADSLLSFLHKEVEPGIVIIGLTSKDISTRKGDVSDWGVMGLGMMPGQTCVISSYRLSKTNRQEELFKVAIHELGHTQGLPHCPVKTCFMRDAEGHNTTGEEKEFCSRCKSMLQSKGWNLR